MVVLPLRPLANLMTLVLLLLAVAASSTAAFSVDPTSSRYFVGRLARRLGIVDFYSSLYRGVKHKLLRPYFGWRRRPRLLRGHRQQLPQNQQNHQEDAFLDIDYGNNVEVLSNSLEVPSATLPPPPPTTLPTHTRTTTDPWIPITTGPSGLYVVQAPDLATQASTTVQQHRQALVTPPEYIRTLPILPVTLPTTSASTTTTTTTTTPPRFLSTGPPTIFTNYSNVASMLPWENTLEQTVTAVYGISSHERTTTDSNFFFTESESEIATERATSSFFERFNPQRETTTPPPYKAFYLPPSTPAQKKKNYEAKTNSNRLKNHRFNNFPSFRAHGRSYETTTLPKIFISSIPPPRYHRVNANAIDRSIVYKDPLWHYYRRRSTTTPPPRLPPPPPFTPTPPPDTTSATFATLQPRFDGDGRGGGGIDDGLLRLLQHKPTPAAQVVGRGPRVLSHGSPTSHGLRNRVLVPVSLLSVYPVYVEEEGDLKTGGGGQQQMLGSEPVMAVAASPAQQQQQHKQREQPLQREQSFQRQQPRPDRSATVMRVFNDGKPLLRLRFLGATNLEADLVEGDFESDGLDFQHDFAVAVRRGDGEMSRLLGLRYNFLEKTTLPPPPTSSSTTTTTTTPTPRRARTPAKASSPLRVSEPAKKRKSMDILRMEIATLLEEIAVINAAANFMPTGEPRRQENYEEDATKRMEEVATVTTEKSTVISTGGIPNAIDRSRKSPD